MGDLPKLPPGMRWTRRGDGLMAEPSRHARMLHSGIVMDEPSQVEGLARDVAADVDHLLRAAITAAATDAGVVLPEGYDVGAVLRAAVEVIGYRWTYGLCNENLGIYTYHLRKGDRVQVGVTGGRTGWMSTRYDPGFQGHRVGVFPTLNAAALGAWDAVGPDGVEMPPLPKEAP